MAFIFMGITSTFAIGQTCSCAGAPLVNSQSLGAVEKGNLVIGLTTDFNNIDQLYTGSKELKNRSSKRETFTTLVEANYGLSSRITLSGTFSYVQKTRTTGLQNSSNSQELETTGIGDALVMLKYSLIKPSLWKPYQLMAGGGMKIPFATNSLKANGLALNADMQPGTGSWDGVGWMLFSYTVRSLDLNVYTMNSYKRTTPASRFSQDDEYKFGNEFNSMLGILKPAFDSFSYSLQLKFRTAEADQRNGSKMPSTGGEWLNIVPGIGYSFTDRLSMQVSGEVPLYQNVNGTQPTTTYIVRASMFFSLDKANTGFSFGLPNNN
ncbi:hypothetical protein [Gracilimonas sp.]|uniref:hypothetical protein n=1 Tax=Gracilimonas sp. TaxID=1974203 RepID=UPI00375195C5